MAMTRILRRIVLVWVGLTLPGVAWAQTAPIQRDKPVYYQADQAEYDSNSGIVTLSGHVEFWQNGRALLADRVTYNRNTDQAAASGNVVLMEPDGQTVFADDAELTGGLKDGVMSGMRALLTQNGRLAANGVRRTDGTINEMGRMVYSTCNLCQDNPQNAPLWQIRANSAVQDTENKLIEYHDAVIDFMGLPVFYAPYLAHPDPSAKRASGLLVPGFGYSKALGAFVAVPSYWVIDGQSDATITPMVATKDGPAVDLQYRRRFNDGTVTINGSMANYNDSFGWNVFGKGQFAIDDSWRWGFDINRASSADYMRDFKVQGWQAILTSQIYLEGFGQGSYSRLDTRFYQGLTTNQSSSEMPFVLPRYTYSFSGQPDDLGGRLSVDTGAFNVMRVDGTKTMRGSFSANWDRPATGALGDVWKATLHLDTAAYSATQFNMQPNWGNESSVEASQAMPTAAIKLNWPLIRPDSGGSLLIEPIVQMVMAPMGSSYVNTHVPNEDALGMEFTTDNLFSLNRFPGIDRLEGGGRANVAMHAAYYFPAGSSLDAMVGQGYRLKPDPAFAPGTGLGNTSTDIVSHIAYSPNKNLDLASNQRFSNLTYNVRFADAIASGGTDAFRVFGGYIYTYNDFYNYYMSAPTATQPQTPRNEITLGGSAKQGPWRVSGDVRRNLQTSQLVSVAASTAYEDECFIFNATMFRRYTSINNDHGATTVLFQITLKTVGQFGFHAF